MLQFICLWTLDPRLKLPLVSQHVFPLFIYSAHIYTSVSVFSFSFLFLILLFVNFVDFFHFLRFFSRLHTSINKFPNFFRKKIVATVRKSTKKNHCSEQGFFHSGFLCYDHPCNFSFCPQAPPIVATGRGEPAPKLVHLPS